MNAACRKFRSRLADVLSGAPRHGELAWHEHLLGCADCRDLLEAEEALETLLATLPEPQLPPALAGRVLARLSVSRGDPLDALLGLDDASDAPPNLAGDVLAGLRPHRSPRSHRALDRLLDRVPAPEVPAGLADRVLRGLEPHRDRPRPRLVTRPVSRLVAALAAAVLIAVVFGVWSARSRGPAGEPIAGAEAPLPAPEPLLAPEPDASTPQGPDDVSEWPPDELLASLELLESWDLLNAEDLDLALASLDTVDEVLLDMEGI